MMYKNLLEGVHESIDFDARYDVAGWGGVAFFLTGFDVQTRDVEVLTCEDTDHEHEWDCGYIDTEEVTNFSMVRAVMVGDDREHLVDVADLTVIDNDDYCGGCGQIGCAW